MVLKLPTLTRLRTMKFCNLISHRNSSKILAYPALSAFVCDEEWKILYSKIKKTKSFPKRPPRIGEVVKWIASLGGFLGRKGDGEPGVMTLWRGWKRLCDLSEGWSLAQA